MFGQSEKEFNLLKLKRLVAENKIDDVKEYVKRYFALLAKPADSVLYWSPSLNEFEILKQENASRRYIRDMKNGTFSLRQWFFNENAHMYYMAVDPSKEPVFKHKGGKFINVFHGYRFKNYKPFSEYSKRVKQNVKDIWKHAKDVLCSNNEKVYQYLKQWTCNLIAGIKLKTCIYLKSNQGTGKSIWTDFLIKVLGDSICYTASNISVLTGFNAQLKGKVLFIFEEMPTTSPSTWMALGNILKNLITGKRIEIQEKYVSSYNIENHTSFIVNTNCDAIRITMDDRRYCICDVSHKYMQNETYFSILGSKMDDETTQEAFYSYCIEHKDESWSERTIPITQSKIDQINENLVDVLKYIKQRWVLDAEAEDVNMLYSDFYKDYVQSRQGKTIKSNYEISKILGIYGLKPIVGTGNKRYFRFTRKEICDIYEKNNWIHELDEYTPPTIQQPDKKVKKANRIIEDLDETEEDKPKKKPSKIIKEEKTEIEELKKQLEKLKNENQQLKKRSHHRTNNLKFTPKL